MAITSFHTFSPNDPISSAELNLRASAINALEAQFRVRELLSGVQDGVNDVFSSSSAFASNSEMVYVNGIPSPNFYTITDTNEVTFESPPKSWWTLEIEYRRA